MTALLAAVWLLVDYPWGLLAFVTLAAPYAGRSSIRIAVSRY
jgi:hypothetical protein